MKNRSILYTLIAIIIFFRILLPVFIYKIDLYYIGLTLDRLRLLQNVADIFIMGALYYYVRQWKQQKLSAVLCILDISILLYLLVIKVMVLLGGMGAPITEKELYDRTLYTYILPSNIAMLINIILSVQFILNKVEEEKIRLGIRLVGILFLLFFCVNIVYVLLSNTGILTMSQVGIYLLYVSSFFSALPYIPMIYLSGQETKNLTKGLAV